MKPILSAHSFLACRLAYFSIWSHPKIFQKISLIMPKEILLVLRPMVVSPIVNYAFQIPMMYVGGWTCTQESETNCENHEYKSTCTLALLRFLQI